MNLSNKNVGDTVKLKNGHTAKVTQKLPTSLKIEVIFPCDPELELPLSPGEYMSANGTLVQLVGRSKQPGRRDPWLGEKVGDLDLTYVWNDEGKMVGFEPHSLVYRIPKVGTDHTLKGGLVGTWISENELKVVYFLFYDGTTGYFDEEWDAAEPELQLEVGKRYRNRAGDIVEIWGKCPVVSDEYPFRGYLLDSTMSYTVSGTYLIGRESPQDLIEEIA